MGTANGRLVYLALEMLLCFVVLLGLLSSICINNPFILQSPQKPTYVEEHDDPIAIIPAQAERSSFR
jgi:hypothetical protein